MTDVLELAKTALLAVEWTGDTSIWSPTCYWCGGYKRSPAMDQDYHGKAGHKPDCARQVALAAIEAAARASREDTPHE